MRVPSRVLLLGCVLALWAAVAEAREVAGVRLPEAFRIAGSVLRLNGMGLSKRMVFVKVYVIGLYLEQPTRDPRAAIEAEAAKRIVIVMLRDVEREAFVKAVERGMQRSSGPAMPTLRERLERLKRALPDLEEGDVLEFTYLPGRGTLMRGQGEELAIPGKDFADALFSVWLGPRASDRGLKRQLLGH